MTEPTRQPTSGETGRPSRLWVPLVILVGLILGIGLSFFVPVPSPSPGFHFQPFDMDPTIRFQVVLSTVGIALLVSLLAVYLRVYSETRANFAAGIAIVVAALLAQQLFDYPLLLYVEGPFELGQGQILGFADVFTVIAYAVFLYLSLE